MNRVHECREATEGQALNQGNAGNLGAGGARQGQGDEGRLRLIRDTWGSQGTAKGCGAGSGRRCLCWGDVQDCRAPGPGDGEAR